VRPTGGSGGRSSRRARAGPLAACVALAAGAGGGAPQAPGRLRLPRPPPGAWVVLRPDALRAIDAPAFVPAERARVAPETPMALLRGRSEERAYSLRLLSRHEIVNDVLDGRPIAVTW